MSEQMDPFETRERNFQLTIDETEWVAVQATREVREVFKSFDKAHHAPVITPGMVNEVLRAVDAALSNRGREEAMGGE